MASTTRITGIAKNTILKLLGEAGEACSVYQDENLRDLDSNRLELDEIWSFVGCKEKMKKKAVGQHPGDVWTWTAIDAETKLVPSWYVGDRTASSAWSFCSDLSDRINGRAQITSDGLAAYKWAIGGNFEEVDFAQLVKIYGKDEKTGMDVVTGIKKVPVFGTPDEDLVSTSYVERQNLTIRMSNRRFTRSTNAFSKKLENHAHMMAVHFMNYNFCRKHKTLGETPAMAAKKADHQWSLEEVVQMIEAYAKRKEEAAFEAAFEARLQEPRKSPKTWTPQKPKTPWYHDPHSGGPPEPLPA